MPSHIQSSTANGCYTGRTLFLVDQSGYVDFMIGIH